MRIGLVTSGHDVLPLFHKLHQYDHSYEIFWDWAYRPRGDKHWELRKQRIEAGITYLQEQGVEKCIVPPVYEIYAQDDDRVLPLFQTYLQNYAFIYSLVGKIGLLCDRADLPSAEDVIKLAASTYTRTDRQQQIKKFHQPFALWKHEVRMRKYFLTTYGRTHRMVRKAIKYDLAYFKDADVDTLVPMNWGFLQYEKIITTQTSWKKIRFHGLDAVADCFEQVTASLPTDTYGVHIHTTGRGADMLLTQNKWRWLLERGKNFPIETTLVDL